MSIFKKIKSILYNFRMGISESTGVGMKMLSGNNNILPPVSFYSLAAENNMGKNIYFEAFKGKKLLLVNLASNCGFTPQYKELQSLQDAHSDKLIILGFPSNDFGGQEPGSDHDIAAFCEVNYGVTFPLFKKASVRGSTVQPIYKWLTDPSLNGWNSQQPTWNFCKYIVDENGKVLNFFSSAVSPLSDRILKSIT